MASENLLTVSQAAKMLHLSEVRVRQLCQEGRIGQKIGTQYVLTKKEIVDFSKVDRPPGRRPAKN